MIPKIIHYCWFGKKEIPLIEKKCIESWRITCPDYEIKRWDESNFNVDSCRYSREAARCQKWAFVSDYARFKILYEYGGIYLDTDVELIKSIDPIIEKGAFFGEELGPSNMVNPGLGMASEAANCFYKRVLDEYNNLSFFKEDGSIDSETVVSKITKILKKNGYVGSGEIEKVCGIYIYPSEYFCPKSFYTGETIIGHNTYSIHHFSGTWQEKEEKESLVIEKELNRIFGIRIGTILGKPVRMFYRIKLRIREKGLFGALEYFWIKINVLIRKRFREHSE